MTVSVEAHLTYQATSPGEVEDIESRLRATSPDTLDVEVTELPDAA